MIKTNELIEMLKEQDPLGNRIIFLRIECDRYSEPVAYGDVDKKDITMSQKDAYQTSEGDRDVLKIMIQMECD